MIALQQLWRVGEALDVLLDSAGPTGGQIAWARALDAAPPQSWTSLKVARQRGKTFTILTWILSRMARERGLSAVYLAQTGANAHAIVQSFFLTVERTLPPEWGAVLRDESLQLANGSELTYFGTDNKQYRRRRGRNARIVALDECGFYDDLLEVEQVYIPQLQTTGGVGVYLSSPPISPAHPFNERCRSAKSAGRYFHDTFWSNERIDHEAVIRGECERLGLTRAGLLESTAFRREFLAEDVTEETRAAVPAWTPEVAATQAVEIVRPEHYDGYVALDWGGYTGDPHAGLWGYWHFERNAVVIEHELELRGVDTSTMASRFKEAERVVWGADRFDGKLRGAKDFRNLPPWLLKAAIDGAPRQPYLRIGDSDEQLLGDLHSLHGYTVCPTKKDEKALAVDELNVLVRELRVFVNPRCARLLEQLFSTIWNKQRSAWERTPRDHGDLVDCLVYMIRNILRHRDPRPKPVFMSTDPVKPPPSRVIQALTGRYNRVRR